MAQHFFWLDLPLHWLHCSRAENDYRINDSMIIVREKQFALHRKSVWLELSWRPESDDLINPSHCKRVIVKKKKHLSYSFFFPFSFFSFSFFFFLRVPFIQHTHSRDHASKDQCLLSKSMTPLRTWAIGQWAPRARLIIPLSPHSDSS